MPAGIPKEVVMARLGIEVALTALESLIEKLEVLPRTQKTLISPDVLQACERVKTAQELVTRLELELARDGGGAGD